MYLYCVDNTTNEQSLMDICGILPTHKIREYTFFSTTLGTFTKPGYVLGHKMSFSKYQVRIIKQTTIFDHNVINFKLVTKR